MKRIIILALAAGACSKATIAPSDVTRTSSCERVQWTVIHEVPKCCHPDNPYGSDFSGVWLIVPSDTTFGAAFPYLIPGGKYLGISSIETSSKLFPASSEFNRGSYFHLVLDNDIFHGGKLLISVPTTAPSIVITPALVIEGGLTGHTLHADWLNNAPFPQVMSATVTAYLGSTPDLSDCRSIINNGSVGN